MHDPEQLSQLQAILIGRNVHFQSLVQLAPSLLVGCGLRQFFKNRVEKLACRLAGESESHDTFGFLPRQKQAEITIGQLKGFSAAR